MSTQGAPPDGGDARPIGRTASAYVALVTAVGLGLTAVAVRRDGVALDETLLVLLVLAALTWFSGPVVVEGRVRLSLASIVLLSAIALLGPAGAGLVGIVVGWLQFGRVPLRARLFNVGQSATIGVLGGAAYVAAGGSPDSSGLTGAQDILRAVGLPIVVASLVQVVVNLVLLVVVVRLADGVPMRTQAAQLLRATGLGYLGYGVIAFLLVVLWRPADLGPASVLLVVAPLLVARWAHGQHADEVRGQERALQVLAAAVEAKAPHLTGHSARVAELSARMAAHLGLRSHLVTDARVAGMLHDLGQTTLPTGLVRGTAPGAGGALATYPERGVALLRDLDFLAGSLDAIARHRGAVAPGPGATPVRLHRAGHDVLAPLVGLADEYDLLTEVGTPDGALLGHAEAVARLRANGSDDQLVRALEWACARRPSGGDG